MTIQTRRLLRIELTVSDLTMAERFYVDRLGFTVVRRDEVQAAMATLLGGGRVSQVVLHRAGQEMALQAFDRKGAPYPAGAAACDQSFQHFAMPVDDMEAAYAALPPDQAVPISIAGPQQLPAHSGGATAYKFRDPDGHPLELIRFAGGAPGGIDHSAIAVTDADRSIAYYCGELGFRLGARQTNTGVEQDHLDGLQGACVDVVALLPEQPTPHVELLAYRTPRGLPAMPARAYDIVATRLVLEVTGLPDPAVTLADGTRAAMVQDPDGHRLILLEHARS